MRKYIPYFGMSVGAGLVLGGIWISAGLVKWLEGIGAGTFALFFFWDKINLWKAEIEKSGFNWG